MIFAFLPTEPAALIQLPMYFSTPAWSRTSSATILQPEHLKPRKVL